VTEPRDTIVTASFSDAELTKRDLTVHTTHTSWGARHSPVCAVAARLVRRPMPLWVICIGIESTPHVHIHLGSRALM